MGDIRREWGSGIAMSDKRARRRGTKEANQDVENKLGGGGGGGLEDAQQRQFGKTRDRRKATWVKEMHEKVDWETQGYRKGKLGKQGT